MLECLFYDELEFSIRISAFKNSLIWAVEKSVLLESIQFLMSNMEVWVWSPTIGHDHDQKKIFTARRGDLGM